MSSKPKNLEGFSLSVQFCFRLVEFSSSYVPILTNQKPQNPPTNCKTHPPPPGNKLKGKTELVGVCKHYVAVSLVLKYRGRPRHLRATTNAHIRHGEEIWGAREPIWVRVSTVETNAAFPDFFGQYVSQCASVNVALIS